MVSMVMIMMNVGSWIVLFIVLCINDIVVLE